MFLVMVFEAMQELFQWNTFLNGVEHVIIIEVKAIGSCEQRQVLIKLVELHLKIIEFLVGWFLGLSQKILQSFIGLVRCSVVDNEGSPHCTEVSFGRIFIVGHNVIAGINPLVLGISTEEEQNVSKLVGSVKVLELCKLIKLIAPEESNFEGSILENWELLSDGVIGGNGNGVLGLGRSTWQNWASKEAEVHGEGRKELELKMSYGDKRLNNNMMQKSELRQIEFIYLNLLKWSS